MEAGHGRGRRRRGVARARARGRGRAQGPPPTAGGPSIGTTRGPSRPGPTPQSPAATTRRPRSMRRADSPCVCGPWRRSLRGPVMRRATAGGGERRGKAAPGPPREEWRDPARDRGRGQTPTAASADLATPRPPGSRQRAARPAQSRAAAPGACRVPRWRPHCSPRPASSASLTRSHPSSTGAWGRCRSARPQARATARAANRWRPPRPPAWSPGLMAQVSGRERGKGRE